MASRSHFPPDATLADLEPWAVTFRLPKAHLDRLLRTAGKAGALPAELVSVVVMHLVPDDPMQAAILHRGLRRWDNDKDTLYVRVPPPVSWRLNRLVEQTLAVDSHATRSRLVAAGVQRAAREPRAQLKTWVEELGSLRAEQATLPAWPPEDVLQQRRPLAGRRTAPRQSVSGRAVKEPRRAS